MDLSRRGDALGVRRRWPRCAQVEVRRPFISVTGGPGRERDVPIQSAQTRGRLLHTLTRRACCLRTRTPCRTGIRREHSHRLAAWTARADDVRPDSGRQLGRHPLTGYRAGRCLRDSSTRGAPAVHRRPGWPLDPDEPSRWHRRAQLLATAMVRLSMVAVQCHETCIDSA